MTNLWAHEAAQSRNSEHGPDAIGLALDGSKVASEPFRNDPVEVSLLNYPNQMNMEELPIPEVDSTSSDSSFGSRSQRNPGPSATINHWKANHFSTGQAYRDLGDQPVLRVSIEGLPSHWNTWDIYQAFSHYGNVARVELAVEGHRRLMKAKVFLSPSPSDRSWIGRRLLVRDSRGLSCRVFCVNVTPQPFIHRIANHGKEYPEKMTVKLFSLDFGVMKSKNAMIILHSVMPERAPSLTLDLHQKMLIITFQTQHSSANHNFSNPKIRQFKMKISISEMRSIHMLRSEGRICFVFSIDSPPQVFRKTTDIAATHDPSSGLWDERCTWYRQTDIDLNPTTRQSAIGLAKEHVIIDIGRWLTYRLTFNDDSTDSTFRDIGQALTEYNIKFHTTENIHFVEADHDSRWYGSSEARQGESWLHEMSSNTVVLAFPVQYQLEACISQGRICECDITQDFIDGLRKMDSTRAVKLLEKVLDQKERWYNPADILRLPVAMGTRKRPTHCSKLLSATVTPTTIYFNTPVLEPSNRVVRKYQDYEDHFLRVKFFDERYRGRLMSRDDRSMDEVFSRIKRAMNHGILIGDRKYEFLAFGNSQFREHGAYFFAATGSSSSALTAQKIRDWMGNFNHIQVVAKYASRLGQCFSTTRAIQQTPTIRQIDDIEHNGHVFTDGVGKISPVLASLIQDHLSIDQPVSVFQFRLGGCKGVLAVDPSIRGLEIHLRPSQQKFPNRVNGLEICRVSQFSAVNLNVQIILVLSALGVSDFVFLSKLQIMLQDLKQAMTNEAKAYDLLRKNVDYNQTSLQLASMIEDGFMETNEPYLISCLRLWRSWNLKYLKQKARIFIEKGAFVFGCVDETGTLRGYSNNTPRYDLRESNQSGGKEDSEDERHDDRKGLTEDKPDIDDTLPEIFLQVPCGPDGIYKVIIGRCLLSRNPALHPGDARVVIAVDVPALRHLRNCVVFPQKGDRDLGNMCAGGDLDGDDYMIIWDPDLIPAELNPEPMDYTPPTPQKAVSGQVTVDDMTSFFVKHIKNDNLGCIAVAHRYWADASDDGVKDPKCIRLAQLHSMAVDYAKTGVPAPYPKDLRPGRWPHWSEPRNKARHKIYHSHKVIGQLYDTVTPEPFDAAWDLSFDDRILKALTPDAATLRAAREVKQLYDESLLRIMTQHGIRTEFEVLTTFVLDHSQEVRDWKCAEVLGETVASLKHHMQDLCYEKANTNRTERNWENMKPFIVAMYTITADEVTKAANRAREHGLRYEALGPIMPLMSFPWIFQRELGLIACGKTGLNYKTSAKTWVTGTTSETGKAQKKHHKELLSLAEDLNGFPEGLEEVILQPTRPAVKIQEGAILDLMGDEMDLGDDGKAYNAQSADHVLRTPSDCVTEANTKAITPIDLTDLPIGSTFEGGTFT